jgi:hypothetical protein
MTTLATATLEIAKLLANVVEGASSNDGLADKTTLIDTAFGYTLDGVNKPPDSFYNGGTIWFRSVTGLTGTTALITGYVRTTGVFTFPAAGARATAGTLYSVADRQYPRYILRQAANAAIQEIGGEDLQYSDATYVTVADQEEYDLPTGKYGVKRVEIATSTSDPYGYREVGEGHWREMNDDIIFTPGHIPSAAGYRIRLTYNVALSEVTTDTGTFPDLYDINWIKWAGAAYCLGWRIGQMRGSDPDEIARLGEALNRAEAAARRFRPKLGNMPHDPQSSVWAVPDTRNSTRDVGEPGKVRL